MYLMFPFTAGQNINLISKKLVAVFTANRQV